MKGAAGEGVEEGKRVRGLEKNGRETGLFTKS